MKVDLQLQQKAKPGWEQRAQKLAQPQLVSVEIELREELALQLSPMERMRVDKKLKLVKQFASWMAAGMVKGSLKYEHDDDPLQEFFAHLAGESADFANYIMLFLSAWEKNAQLDMKPHLKGGGILDSKQLDCKPGKVIMKEER